MTIRPDGALSRRLRALEQRVESEEEDSDTPVRIDLPSIITPRGERPTDEQVHDGVPAGYILFVIPDAEPEPIDPETGYQPPCETWTWLRIAFRQTGRR